MVTAISDRLPDREGPWNYSIYGHLMSFILPFQEAHEQSVAIPSALSVYSRPSIIAPSIIAKTSIIAMICC